VVDAPVVVASLTDREDLILQGVGVVADDAELDGGDGHSGYVLHHFKNDLIRFTVFET
jgi:hypothetical protein